VLSKADRFFLSGKTRNYFSRNFTTP